MVLCQAGEGEALGEGSPISPEKPPLGRVHVLRQEPEETTASAVSPPEVTEAEKLRSLPWQGAHHAFNATFTSLTFFGPVFLLLLSELGLPKAQMGLLLSLFPFCGLLALGFAPVATRMGRKRVFLACYGGRKLVVFGLLLLPWVISRFGHSGGLAYLIGIVSIFGILRALAETAWYPWSQEIVPDRVRGRFSAVTTVLAMLASSAALAFAGYVIKHRAGLDGFLLLIGIGTAAGIIGVLVLLMVPGGIPRSATVGSGTHWAQMREALRDRNFTLYLAGLACVTVGTLLYLSFLPLFLKERLGVPPGLVVTLETAVMIGGGVSALLWGWLADRVGSRPVLMPAVALTILIPLGWLLLPRQAAHLIPLCAALYFIHGVAYNGVAIGAGRLLLNGVIPPQQSTAYTALYYAGLGLVGGLAPLLAGGILQGLGGWQAHWWSVTLDSHSILFALAVLLVIAGAACYARVRPDDRYRTRDVLQWITTRLSPHQ
jgi:MFS family permease